MLLAVQPKSAPLTDIDLLHAIARGDAAAWLAFTTRIEY
jgi:hypothetical protein